MAAGEVPIPRIPESLMAELERLARDQERSVSQVLAEAVDRYVKEEQWQRLKSYGRERARSLNLREADVTALVEESRREYGKDR